MAAGAFISVELIYIGDQADPFKLIFDAVEVDSAAIRGTFTSVTKDRSEFTIESETVNGDLFQHHLLSHHGAFVLHLNLFDGFTASQLETLKAISSSFKPRNPKSQSHTLELGQRAPLKIEGMSLYSESETDTRGLSLLVINQTLAAS